MITGIVSRTDGRRSFAARAGSTSSNRPGAVGPDRAIVAPPISPSWVIRCPSHGGTHPRVSSAACAARACFTWGSNHETSTYVAPRP